MEAAWKVLEAEVKAWSGGHQELRAGEESNGGGGGWRQTEQGGDIMTCTVAARALQPVERQEEGNGIWREKEECGRAAPSSGQPLPPLRVPQRLVWRSEAALQLLLLGGMPGERLQRVLVELDARGWHLDTWVRVPTHPAYVVYTCGRVVRAPSGDPRAG